MKLHLVPLVLVVALASVAMAEEKVTLSDVHNCCKSCTKGIQKAVGTVPGVKADVEKSTVVLTGGSDADLQKAVDAITAAGYTGASDKADVKVKTASAADEQVKSLTVSGVHLCCGKCVKAVESAVKAVPGVKSDTATKGAKSFEVTGDFNAKVLMDALAKAGFTGTATTN
ncbi:MAG TPA: cation transporter [Tepidisphaeraceae bacterium]|jgi:copper chaperone CopZ